MALPFPGSRSAIPALGRAEISPFEQVSMPLSYLTFHGSGFNTPYTPRTLSLSGW